ncbi:hypothetical protein TNCV_2385601 [Trichonephila clavipes]|nr:hypothetical protein TNCV_2385601 [Trichonephila clavipes]
MGISLTVVWRIVPEQRMHPSHVQGVRCLQTADYLCQADFVQWRLRMKNNDQRFPAFLLYSNPHYTTPRKPQQKFSANAWAGILGDYLVDPYILPDRLTYET